MGTVGEGATPRQERLRFVGLDFERLPSSRCRARVTLEWGADERFEGTAQGLASEAGELRCVAQATLSAIEHAVSGRSTFDLLGVKAVRAFDAVVLIVSISVQEAAGSRRLVGSYLAGDDAPRGAAVAVLNATNRMLGNIFTRDAR